MASDRCHKIDNKLLSETPTGGGHITGKIVPLFQSDDFKCSRRVTKCRIILRSHLSCTHGFKLHLFERPSLAERANLHAKPATRAQYRSDRSHEWRSVRVMMMIPASGHWFHRLFLPVGCCGDVRLPVALRRASLAGRGNTSAASARTASATTLRQFVEDRLQRGSFSLGERRPGIIGNAGVRAGECIAASEP